jgi:hypothetical protein
VNAWSLKQFILDKLKTVWITTFKARLSRVSARTMNTIGGARGWEDIEIYGVSHEVWLRYVVKNRSQFLRRDYSLEN